MYSFDITTLFLEVLFCTYLYISFLFRSKHLLIMANSTDAATSAIDDTVSHQLVAAACTGDSNQPSTNEEADKGTAPQTTPS